MVTWQPRIPACCHWWTWPYAQIILLKTGSAIIAIEHYLKHHLWKRNRKNLVVLVHCPSMLRHKHCTILRKGQQQQQQPGFWGANCKSSVPRDWKSLAPNLNPPGRFSVVCHNFVPSFLWRLAPIRRHLSSRCVIWASLGAQVNEHIWIHWAIYYWLPK